MIGRQGAPPGSGQARGRIEGPADGFSTLFLNRSQMLRGAYELAAGAHAGQRQETDDSPYIEHAVAVARLLRRSGFGDEVVAAGLLHDTVEDSGVELQDLERRFGRQVARLVSAMTEPEWLPDFRIRKGAHRTQIAAAGCEAAAIFAADKIVNVRNLRQALARYGEESVRRRLTQALEQKIEHYRKTLEMLENLALPLSLTPVLKEEIARLEGERPHQPERQVAG